MVAGFPDFKRSAGIAAAIAGGGAEYLEVQFPYSDPSADGPVIQRACSRALQEGFTKDAGFRFVRETAEKLAVPVFIMSYAGLVFSGGVRDFVWKAREAGASGLIIPDLNPGYDEELYRFGREAGLAVVPVIAPTVGEKRLSRIAAEKPEFVYAVLRTGVTGDRTELGEPELRFLRRLTVFGAKVCAGFGIRSREQVVQLSPHVHALIVGSMIVDVIEKSLDYGDTLLYSEVHDNVRYLITGWKPDSGEDGCSGQKKKTDG